MKAFYIYLLLPAMFFLQLNSLSANNNLTDDPKPEFSAKIDGKDWQAGIVGCDVEISSVEFFGFTDGNGLKISLDEAPVEGTFEISKKSKHKISYGSTEVKYTIGTSDEGKVIITKYDKVKKIFSGSFEATLTNEKTGKKIKITEGVFTKFKVNDKQKNGFNLDAKLNGARWKWMAATHHIGNDSASFSGVMENSNFYLHVKFPSNIQTGEYNISADGPYYAEYKSLKNSDDHGLLPKTGKLIILKNDEKKGVIAGKFEIEMIDVNGNTKARFTDGSFTMLYTDK